ncbi:MAG: hypothetical protein BGP10_15860 [Rhodanobacter sp. 68-29]|nr:hypothetical protein [Rhodanobacter sp.]ODV27872.1 MAG: hypothetical protein ABT19_01430 [Rhodanobacter sp. SCN 68-63]OJY61381.1 MAG: hypothetical protein BGP10_15860 [Rhodanobacter sp. 68-29]
MHANRMDFALPNSAPDILANAAAAIDQRAAARDHAQGERSMARAVHAFNAMYGCALSEVQGWQFMALLKMARSTGGKLHIDDYIDQSAYAALAGEAAEREGLRACIAAIDGDVSRAAA